MRAEDDAGDDDDSDVDDYFGGTCSPLEKRTG